MGKGLAIGRCDAGWRVRPDQAWPILDLTGTTGSLGADELRRSCRDLRFELLAADEPWRQLELLRSLVAHRVALGDLDADLVPMSPVTADVPAIAADGSPGPDVPPAAATVAPGPAGGGDVVSAPEPEEPEIVVDGRSGPGPEEAPADTVVPDRPLTLRFLVEGAPGAGTTTVLEMMAEHFETVVTTGTVVERGPMVRWLQFDAGSFEGQPIRFEVCSLEGQVERATRRYLRTLVDAIILVVDASPDGLDAGAERVVELRSDGAGRTDLDRADLTVFAHKSDRADAVGVDVAIRRLRLPDEVRIVATSWERRGSSHGLALATSSALRRLERRDDGGRHRTVALSLTGFVTLVRGGLPTGGGPSPAADREPAPSTSANGSAPPPSATDPDPTPSMPSEPGGTATRSCGSDESAPTTGGEPRPLVAIERSIEVRRRERPSARSAVPPSALPPLAEPPLADPDLEPGSEPDADPSARSGHGEDVEAVTVSLDPEPPADRHGPIAGTGSGSSGHTPPGPATPGTGPDRSVTDDPPPPPPVAARRALAAAAASGSTDRSVRRSALRRLLEVLRG